MILVSWNVNGIRSVSRKGFEEWLQNQQPDILCVQEIKAQTEQLTPELIAPEGYQGYWHSAEKKGYSGVATFTKQKPLSVHYGIGENDIDREGRVLSLEYNDFVVINAYFPNSQRGGARLDYKLFFCEKMLSYCQDWVKQGKNIVLCGDYNIAHQEIDLKNPKSNKKNAGFLPEERDWMTHFLSSGFIDIFRLQHPDEKDHYTWWSYRPGIRERNVGWRIDYHCVNAAFEKKVVAAGHWPAVMGSDHCPIFLEIQ